MKLVGNSVSVPVIQTLTKAIIATGVFDERLNKKTIVECEDYEMIAI